MSRMMSRFTFLNSSYTPSLLQWRLPFPGVKLGFWALTDWQLRYQWVSTLWMTWEFQAEPNKWKVSRNKNKYDFLHILDRKWLITGLELDPLDMSAMFDIGLCLLSVVLIYSLPLAVHRMVTNITHDFHGHHNVISYLCWEHCFPGQWKLHAVWAIYLMWFHIFSQKSVGNGFQLK